MTARNSPTQSWDEFWTEVSTVGRTEVIRGVEVPVPTDLPLGFDARLERLSHLGEDSKVEEFEELVASLFGPGVFEQWIDADMGAVELLTAITWGMAQGKGRDLSFREAYEIVKSDDPGKAVGANRETRRAAKKAASKPLSKSTGGPSKRTSSASTASARTRSRS